MDQTKLIKKLKKKKKLLFPILMVMGIVIGFGMASLMLSNRVEQSIEIYGLQDTLDVSIETPLTGFVFKGDSVSTSFKIERIDTTFEGTWVIFMSWNLSGLLEAQHISGTKTAYDSDHTTVLSSGPWAIAAVDNGSSCYDMVVLFNSWSGDILQGDIMFIDILFSIDVASPLTGPLEVALWVTNGS